MNIDINAFSSIDALLYGLFYSRYNFVNCTCIFLYRKYIKACGISSPVESKLSVFNHPSLLCYIVHFLKNVRKEEKSDLD